jgi:hypothetical protein
MNIIPYERLNVTTMTLIMSLNNEINTEIAFHLLPIMRMEVARRRETSKCKLPHCDIPGSILSMRFRHNVRGVIRNKSTPFKNAVTIDISTKKKNISLKLSAFSIQMCGASSKEDGEEAAMHIINHLHRIQNILNKIALNLTHTLTIIEWVKEHSKGALTEKPNWELHVGSNISLKVYTPTMDHFIVKPDIPFPAEFDPDIANFVVSMTEDFLYHSDMIKKLDYIPKFPPVIKEAIYVRRLDMAMVNYNYSLGFEIDRDRLNQCIDGQNGFISRYNNALATSVTIELPYEPPADSAIKRRKGKIPHHTFLVYRSGSVTQSGPGGKLMEDAYYLFINTIISIIPYIHYANPQTPQIVPVTTPHLELLPSRLEKEFLNQELMQIVPIATPRVELLPSRLEKEFLDQGLIQI